VNIYDNIDNNYRQKAGSVNGAINIQAVAVGNRLGEGRRLLVGVPYDVLP
jgi:hypothetical protein